MIRDIAMLNRWENDYRRREPVNFLENLRLYEALYAEACALGLFPLKDPLEGLPLKIQMARALNVSTTA